MLTDALPIKARSLLFLMLPGAAMPFQSRLGLQTYQNKLQALGDFTIMNCISIEDAIQKSKKIVESLGLSYAEDFTLVLPHFPTHNSNQEAEMINNAWLITEMADLLGWLFSRIIPSPDF